MKKLQRIIGTAEILAYELMYKAIAVSAKGAVTATSTAGMVESMTKDTGMFSGIIAIWQSIVGSAWGLLTNVVIGAALVYGLLAFIGFMRGGKYRDMAKDNLLWIVLGVFGVALLGKVITAVLVSATGA